MADENPVEKVEKVIKSEPWYIWAGAAGAAGIVIYFVWKRKQAAAPASTASGATQSGSTAADVSNLNGYTVDSMAGLPFGSIDASGYNYQGGPMANTGSYSEVGVNGNQVPIIPAGDTPIYDGSGNLIGWQTPGPTTSPAPAPTPAPTPPPVPGPIPGPAPIPAQTEMGTIRAKQTTGRAAGWDSSNSGVPLRSTPGGAVLSEVPFGSQITISGTPVQGPDNFGPNPADDPTHSGSMLWFPVQNGSSTGFVSAFDIINLSPLGQGSGGDSGGFHLPINAGRNTMDQWTFANGMHQDFHSYAGEVN